MQQTEYVKRVLESGNTYPYDASDLWRDSEDIPEKPIDWAHSAARGILNNLSDRRGIKQELSVLDEDTRIEIIRTLSDIIREAFKDSNRVKNSVVKS